MGNWNIQQKPSFLNDQTFSKPSETKPSSSSPKPNSVESDPGYESDPANTATAALLALQKSLEEQSNSHFGLTLNKKTNKVEEEANGVEELCPVTMKVFAPIRVRLAVKVL